jgi:hypothetical protein
MFYFPLTKILFPARDRSKQCAVIIDQRIVEPVYFAHHLGKTLPIELKSMLEQQNKGGERNKMTCFL